MPEEKKYDNVVLALDTLIGDPEIINPDQSTPQVAPNLVISTKYLEKFYEIYYEQSTRGDASKKCMELLNYHMAVSEKSHECLLDNGTILRIVEPKREALKGLSRDNTGHQAIALAKAHGSKSVAVMTGSGRLAPIVRLNKVDVSEIQYEPYTGRRKLWLPYAFSSEWHSNHRISKDLFAEIWPDEPPLRANEFVEFQSGPSEIRSSNFANIGRYDANEEALIPLKHTKNLPYGIYPRNAGQAMIAEALMMPPDELPIVIIQGTFGTGKTFLSLAAGLSQTEGNGQRSIYDKIFVVPRDAYLGQEHGYIPGDLFEKIRPLIGSVFDNLGRILKIRGPNKSKYSAKNGNSKIEDRNWITNDVERYLTESGLFDFVPPIYMGGRSISDSFIIFDEFQDTERGQAKALLTRIGDGSKNVIMGDPTQFTNPHLSRSSNGLVFAANEFKDYAGAAVISMFPYECERSAAAKAISEIFK